MRSLATVLVFSSLAAACAQPAPAPAPAPTPKPDLAAEERAIRALDAQWLKLVAAKDAAGETALFADDGVAYRVPVGAVPKASYEEFTKKFWADNPKAQISWTAESVRVAESADLAVQVGETQSTGMGPKGSGKETVRYVTVWKKVNGQWKVAYDIGIPVTAGPPPKG